MIEIRLTLQYYPSVYKTQKRPLWLFCFWQMNHNQWIIQRINQPINKYLRCFLWNFKTTWKFWAPVNHNSLIIACQRLLKLRRLVISAMFRPGGVRKVIPGEGAVGNNSYAMKKDKKKVAQEGKEKKAMHLKQKILQSNGKEQKASRQHVNPPTLGLPPSSLFLWLPLTQSRSKSTSVLTYSTVKRCLLKTIRSTHIKPRINVV